FVTYWSFRAMIGLGVGSFALALAGLWVTRRGRVPDQKWFSVLSLVAIPTPFLANSAGWIFTEMGRQPWVVHPAPNGVDMIRLTVDQGVSHNAAWTVWLSLITLTAIYGALFVVWFGLIRRYAKAGPSDYDRKPPDDDTDTGDSDDDSGEPKKLSFAY
ncbi:MAG: cytochrome ubiquinol oxidase subunit I, partial [Rhodococcus sp.]|nr:cytochrome ubiquinol oxidase subunit I [Rhodococcus sp. (in: high G+C Gram-positive bacteria)]